MRRCLPLLLVAAAAATGCITTVDVSRTVEPSSAPADRSSEKAGVVCTHKLLDSVARASYYELDYEARIGDALCSSLQKSVEGTYRSAERTVDPYRGQFGRVVKFDLRGVTLDVQKHDGLTRVACSISVVVEHFGRDMQRQSTKGVSGNGFVERHDATDAVMRDAIETALQQVVDNASSLLVAGIDGPRIQASQPR